MGQFQGPWSYCLTQRLPHGGRRRAVYHVNGGALPSQAGLAPLNHRGVLEAGSVQTHRARAVMADMERALVRASTSVG
eukprot:2552574-Lingulodinium_polyedra.AAC.1